MDLENLKSKIQKIAKEKYKERISLNDKALAYDEILRFPELKNIIIDLLTINFDKFIESIDWVAPKPTTFRVNLLNNQNFLLIFTERSWIAVIEGKRYYLLNLDESERATESLARILSYGAFNKEGDEDLDAGNEDEMDMDIEDTSEEPTPEPESED